MPFVKGQSGNPGGKPGAPRQALSELLEAVFNPTRRRKVLEKLIVDAELGNHDARVLLLAYTYGRPTEYKEITGSNGGPIRTEVYEYNAAIADLAARSGEDSDASG